jgi:hypothetical protein
MVGRMVGGFIALTVIGAATLMVRIVLIMAESELLHEELNEDA